MNLNLTLCFDFVCCRMLKTTGSHQLYLLASFQPTHESTMNNEVGLINYYTSNTARLLNIGSTFIFKS